LLGFKKEFLLQIVCECLLLFVSEIKTNSTQPIPGQEAEFFSPLDDVHGGGHLRHFSRLRQTNRHLGQEVIYLKKD